MSNDEKPFAVGDVVRATKKITRVDGRCYLGFGQKARIRSVYNMSTNDGQIVDIELSNGNIMIDIVCFAGTGIPLDHA